MMNLYKSMEMIQTQVNSALAKEINACFTDVFTYKNNIINKGESNTDIAISIDTYFKKTSVPKLKKAISTYAGFTINDIILFTDMPAYLFGMVLDADKLDDFIPFCESIQTSEGTKSYKSIESLSKDIEALKSLDYIDTKNSMIVKESEFRQKLGKSKLKFNLHIDVPSAFYPEHYGVQEQYLLNAEELTAIILHEIGHFFWFLEHITYCYSLIAKNNKHLSTVIENSSEDELFYSVDTFIKPTVEQLKSTNPGAYSICDILIKIIDKLRESMDTMLSIQIQFLPLLLKILRITIIQSFKFISGTLLMTAINAILFSTIKEFNLILVTPDAYKKSTDTYKTIIDRSYNERASDEFATRHGYGAYLLSALSKIHNNPYVNTGGLGQILFYTIGRFKFIAFFLNLIFSIPTLGFLPGDVFNYQYEKEYSRLSRILQNIIRTYKGENTKQVNSYFVKQYEDAVIALKKHTNTIAYKRKQFNELIMHCFGSPAKVVSMILTGRMTKEYETYLNQLDNLMNNKLYYYGAKFSTL